MKAYGGHLAYAFLPLAELALFCRGAWVRNEVGLGMKAKRCMMEDTLTTLARPRLSWGSRSRVSR